MLCTHMHLYCGNSFVSAHKICCEFNVSVRYGRVSTTGTEYRQTGYQISLAYGFLQFLVALVTLSTPDYC